MLADLVEWLRIPSVSTGEGSPADLKAGAAWVCDRVRRSGGQASLVPTRGNPLAVGRLRAADPRAPTVLIYGHYDVQGPGDPHAWTTPPFEPDVRGGRIYARGAADDKGNLLPLLHAACELHAAGELPVHVRVVVEGEEERGSASLVDWLRADEEGADVAIAFDALMADETTPAITLGLRGLLTADVAVRGATHDLHSGVYGGAALSAADVLLRALAACTTASGRPVDPLRRGVLAPSEAEIRSWAALPDGGTILREGGARPADPAAAAAFYARTWAEPSFDVHQLRCGEARTLVPAEAHAHVSLRLAPGQRCAELVPALDAVLAGACPTGAEIDLTVREATDPVLLAADHPAAVLAADALRQADRGRVALTRSGGSIPAVAVLAERGIPTIVSGFALPADRIHGVDESFRIDALRAGEASARALLHACARLPRTRPTPPLTHHRSPS